MQVNYDKKNSYFINIWFDIKSFLVQIQGGEYQVFTYEYASGAYRQRTGIIQFYSGNILQLYEPLINVDRNWLKKPFTIVLITSRRSQRSLQKTCKMFFATSTKRIAFVDKSGQRHEHVEILARNTLEKDTISTEQMLPRSLISNSPQKNFTILLACSSIKEFLQIVL